MRKPGRSMKSPLRRKSSLERRRMLATGMLSSRLGSAFAWTAQIPDRRKRKPLRNDRGLQVTCQRELGMDGGGNARLACAGMWGIG